MSTSPGSTARSSHAVPLACLLGFGVVWIVCAIAPHDRADWALENVPTFIGVPAAVLTYRRFRFSNRAYVQAALMLMLHTVGSHYTYSLVPAGDWLRDGFALSRNHYDRIVHFLFGVLMLRPLRELGFRNGQPGPAAVYFFSVSAIACWSLLYEVVEWLVAQVADPAAGIAYVGTQGDIWDAQKDMALALVGALIAGGYEWWSDAAALRRPTRPR